MNVNRELLAFLRKQYPVGTRIRLDSMQDPYAPVEAGTTGKLDYIDDAGQFHMKWDNGRTLALIPGVDSFTVLPPELSMTKLYMPLTAELYEPDVYGNMQEEPELLTGHDLTAYEDHIRSALVKYRMPEEVNRGIMHWYDAADSVNDKVRSVTFDVERRNGKLWGIAECQISGELSAAELTTLKEYIEGQASDGWGEGFEQHEIAVGRGSELYLKRYMMGLNNLGEENPHLLSGFLFRVGHGECIGTKELVEYFRGDIKVLCTAYIYAHQGRSYYDFDGELFSELIRGNPEFLADYVHKVAGKQIGRDGWHALNILWQQDDYLKLISIVMECLKNATKPFFTWDSLAEDLLSSPINMPLVNKRRNEWIKYYVEANCYDGESMRFLFGIVCNLPEEQRLPAIVTFCQCNPAFEAFRSIYIIPTHASWSGSEVPILEQHIAFLSEIKDSLRGMQFVEHRAHISEKIRNLQERKEDVLLREFLEER